MSKSIWGEKQVMRKHNLDSYLISTAKFDSLISEFREPGALRRSGLICIGLRLSLVYVNLDTSKGLSSHHAISRMHHTSENSCSFLPNPCSLHTSMWSLEPVELSCMFLFTRFEKRAESLFVYLHSFENWLPEIFLIFGCSMSQTGLGESSNSMWKHISISIIYKYHIN